MITVGDIYDIMDQLAPFETQEEWDNSGLLIGSREDEATDVLVTLDATARAIDRAKELGCQLIISHHPLIFSPLRKIPRSSNVYRLIESGIDLISSHTPLDKAPGGVSDCLADALGLRKRKPAEGLDFVYTGVLPKPLSAKQLAQQVSEAIQGSGRGPVTVDGGREITKVAVIGGAGSDIAAALLDSDCDAIVTGELKHHIMIAAQEKGKTLIEAGHYETEAAALYPLSLHLKEKLPELLIHTFIDPIAF
ncbi:MAG: Nif3-like dinuclear metal center hexameric protein [Ruminococcaceae bacterium]|nr:Nif3-like dinuclear metal center hexameric protein [Oscillospiraceae bacterium]